MALIDDLLFEMERRSILFHRDTTMPDASQLGYTGDPNNAVPGNTDGEFLIHNSPSGTNYMDKGVSPYQKWTKVDDTAGGLWVKTGAGAAAAPPLIRKFIVTNKFEAGEVITLATGGGAIAGSCIVSGDTIPSLGGTAADFYSNTQAHARVNGTFANKGTNVIWDSGTTMHFAEPLDVDDWFEITINSI